MVSLLNVGLFRRTNSHPGGFPIAVTIPSRTMIAKCTAYSVEEEDEDM